MEAISINARMLLRFGDRDLGIAVRTARMPQIPLKNIMIFNWCSLKNNIVALAPVLAADNCPPAVSKPGTDC